MIPQQRFYLTKASGMWYNIKAVTDGAQAKVVRGVIPRGAGERRGRNELWSMNRRSEEFTIYLLDKSTEMWYNKEQSHAGRRVKGTENERTGVHNCSQNVYLTKC